MQHAKRMKIAQNIENDIFIPYNLKILADDVIITKLSRFKIFKI